MLKHYTIPTDPSVQASLLWPVPSTHGDIGILKIKLDEAWRQDIRTQAIIFKALAFIETMADFEQGEMIVQVTVDLEESINLVRVRHTTHWAPGLTWHRGTTENLAESLDIDPALLGPSDLPLYSAPELPAHKVYTTERYLLVNDEYVQAYFDWPVPSAQGDIALVTVREPHKIFYSQRASDLTLHAARIIFERFGIMVEHMVTHTYQPKCEDGRMPHVWDIVNAQWHSVGKTSSPQPDGVWNFVNKDHIKNSLNLTDDVLDADLPCSDVPPVMPPAREIMSPEKRIQDKIGKDADLLLDCLERISKTLQQGRSVGFQVGLSEGAIQMLTNRHGERAERILANCQRLESAPKSESTLSRLVSIVRKSS